MWKAPQKNNLTSVFMNQTVKLHMYHVPVASRLFFSCQQSKYWSTDVFLAGSVAAYNNFPDLHFSLCHDSSERLCCSEVTSTLSKSVDCSEFRVIYNRILMINDYLNLLQVAGMGTIQNLFKIHTVRSIQFYCGDGVHVWMEDQGPAGRPACNQASHDCWEIFHWSLLCDFCLSVHARRTSDMWLVEKILQNK